MFSLFLTTSLQLRLLPILFFIKLSPDMPSSRHVDHLRQVSLQTNCLATLLLTIRLLPHLASSCHGSQTYLDILNQCLISLTLHIFATSLTSFSDHSLLINIDSFKCSLPMSLLAWSWHKATPNYLPIPYLLALPTHKCNIILPTTRAFSQQTIIQHHFTHNLLISKV